MNFILNTLGIIGLFIFFFWLFTVKFSSVGDKIIYFVESIIMKIKDLKNKRR
jgi:hypothetical protein